MDKNPINGIRSSIYFLLVAILWVCTVTTGLADGPPSAAATKITIVGSQTGGLFNSLALKKNNFPVISYLNSTDGVVELAICLDLDCKLKDIEPLGINDGKADASTSLQINALDIPFVSFISINPPEGEGFSTSDVSLAVCANPDCNPVSIKSLIPDASVIWTTQVLNSSSYPIIGWTTRNRNTGEFAKIAALYCEDPFCNKSSEQELGRALAYEMPSLAITSTDIPMLSGYETGENDPTGAPDGLHFIKCVDVACSVVVRKNLDGYLSGHGSSLAVNKSNRPRISYLDEGNGVLKMISCEIADCSMFRTIVLDDDVDTSEFDRRHGANTSLAIDRSGFSVISYYSDSHRLKVAACNNVLCTNPTLTEFLGGSLEGRHSSLALNGSDTPVISYSGEAGTGHLNMAICPMCTVPARVSLENGSFSSLKLTSKGNPVVSYWSSANNSLDIDVCLDELCSESNSFTVDDSGSIGFNPSLALTKNDFPVISYWDFGNRDLKLAICKDASCSNPTFKTIDGSASDVGFNSSLKLNNSGLAVISYFDQTNKDLKLAVCNDVNCSNPTITLVDGETSDVGWYNSMVLNKQGFPIISYQDTANEDLVLAICNDVYCENKTIRVFDTPQDHGEFSSLALDSSGFPVISFYDKTDKDLMLIVCTSLDCSSWFSRPLDSNADYSFVGEYTSLALTEDDYPVISYEDHSIGAHDIKVLLCNDPRCSRSTITTVDQEGVISDGTSLALRDDGFPVISYHPGGMMKVAIYQAPTDTVFADGFE